MSARSIWRALRVVEHLTTGAVISLAISPRLRRDQRPPWLPGIVRWWHARLCRALEIQVRVEGRPEANCLLVGNHVSWLDVPVLGARSEIAFLSKADVRHWPLIGWMARIAGTRFIERGAHQSETVLVQLREDLALGRTIMIFPEGTTTDGRDVLRFHPRLFGIAQSSGVRLQPVAIRYQRGTDPTPDQDVPYVGEDTLIANLWRLMRHPGLIACVHFLPPIQADRDERRRALAERARRMIVEALDSAEGAPANDRSEAATETAASAIGLDPRPA